MAKKTNPEIEAPKTLEEALEVINSLKSELASQAEIIAEMRATPGKNEAPTFTHEKKTYAVKVKSFSLHGTNHTAADLCSNKDLQVELIEMEAGFIEEVAE